ncbi:MAG: TatD family hydrolase [Gemmatimonadota bacterium]|nr:TatD family hydrolase [Gemmatimonadota bacterium]
MSTYEFPEQNIPLYDSHAHLTDKQFLEKEGDLEAVVGRALRAGVRKIVNVGIDEPTSALALEQAARFPGTVYATAGLHPHDARKFSSRTMGFFDGLAADERVVAIGETGLDYHYDYSPREKQRQVFGQHLELAAMTRLPLVIHCRKAYDDLVEILQKYFVQDHVPWLVHCFSGGMEDLERLKEFDCYFSLGGSITFKNFSKADIVRAIPEDRLLLETDCPYLAPVPRRGRRNEPALLVHTAQVLEGMRGLEMEEISRMTCENFERLFGVAEHKDS